MRKFVKLKKNLRVSCPYIPERTLKTFHKLSFFPIFYFSAKSQRYSNQNHDQHTFFYEQTMHYDNDTFSQDSFCILLF